jgi:hypothetical protein
MSEAAGLSPWFYVGLSYGLTWVAFGVYLFRMHARRTAALRTLTDREAAK